MEFVNVLFSTSFVRPRLTIEVSSANKHKVLQVKFPEISLKYNGKSKGPNTDTYGTPFSIFIGSELVSSYFVICSLPGRYDSSNLCVVPRIP